MSSTSQISDIKKTIKDNEIKFINFYFTDHNGKWFNISHDITSIDDSAFKDGVAFDGSSVPNWKPINQSDMIMMPQLDTAFIDSFTAFPTLNIICNIIEPEDNSRYEKDPRTTAIKAEEYLKSTGIGDKAYFGPEPEFFIFDDVKYSNQPNSSYYKLDSEESPLNSSQDYENGNMGHRSAVKEAYFNSSPTDIGSEIRMEIMEVMKSSKISPILHHHEVANSQYEIGFKYDTLANTGDNIQKFKYITKNIANAFGKSATFIPKPIDQDNGSGMHVHQSIWKDGKSLFFGDSEAGLSELALYYIGGIIKHIKAINAFCNPSINSYKRLIPGFEAPVILAYSGKNRSASIRIPYVPNKNARRIETRFPDPSANPYLAFSSLLMAGIDGIQNKIHPGKADNRDLYALNAKELKKLSTVSRSLEDSLNALNKDRGFLKKGGVFTDNQIDSYIDLKRQEIERYNNTPTPLEIEMYYNC